jgi:hypothetical protein
MQAAPVPAWVTQLLRAISDEAALHPNTKDELKTRLHAVGEHTHNNLEPPSFSHMAVAGADAPIAPALDLECLPAGPPSQLLKELSAAAAAGSLPVHVKTDLKSMILNARRGPTRLTRQVTAEEMNEAQKMQLAEKMVLRTLYGEKDFTDLTAAAHEAAKLRNDVAPFSRVYGLKVRPPTSSQCPRGLSAILRFNLPLRYPFVRPSFKVIKVKGRFIEPADAMMLGTEMNDVLNKIYAAGEPKADAAPCLVALLEAAQEFLGKFAAYLGDRAHHMKIAEEIRMRKAAEVELQGLHAAAVLAYSASQLKGVDLHDYSQPSSTYHEQQLQREEKERQALEAVRLKTEQLAAYMSQIAANDERKEDEPRFRASLEYMTSLEAMESGGFSHAFLDLMPSSEDVLTKVECADIHHQFGLASSSDIVLKPIVSPFLAYTFMQRHEEYFSRGVGEWEMSFHGCNPDVTESITTNGLIVPGQVIPSTGEILPHRSGNNGVKKHAQMRWHQS